MTDCLILLGVVGLAWFWRWANTSHHQPLYRAGGSVRAPEEEEEDGFALLGHL